ncbi:hypothetical protein D3C73_1452780 [compost metagenome]
MLRHSTSVPTPVLERWQQRHSLQRQYLEDVLSRCRGCENPVMAASQFLLLVIGRLDNVIDSVEEFRAAAAVDIFVRAWSEK